jgi:K+-transporting ATPase KdpF subunit
MSLFQWVGAMVALFLLVYLVYGLIRAERL